MTCKTVLEEMREAVKLRIPFEKTIQNYRKDGRVYKCKINALPVFNVKGKVTHFIAFEKDLSV